MKKKILLTAFSFMILLNGCGLYNKMFHNRPEILLTKDFSDGSIAVLGFAKQGSFSGDVGRLSADKLTDALFLSGRYTVIDRAAVNDAQKFLEISSTESLSIDQIQKIGLKIKSNYLILGRVQNVNLEDSPDSDPLRRLYISFRIISVADAEIIGVVNYSFEYNEKNLVEELQEKMKKIVKEMSGS